MNENKGQTIFLSVIGIATLLVAIVGATFAWFSASVTGNDQASSVTVTAAKIASVVFAETNTVTATNALPGWSAAKTFTVTRPAGATATQNYTVTLTYTNTAAAGGTNIQDMYYILTKNSTAGAETQINATSATITIDTGSFTLGTEEVNTYSLLFKFKETGLDQNSQQGAAFSGLIQVQVDGGTTTYYNNDNPTGTNTAPSAQ